MCAALTSNQRCFARHARIEQNAAVPAAKDTADYLPELPHRNIGTTSHTKLERMLA
jgi:hypothetical protein